MANVYSSLKLFQYQEHIEAIRNKKILAPVHIRIKPENACNHDCWFCAYRVDNLELGEDMSERDRIPENKMYEIIDDILEMGVKAVTFSGGGEPLAYKHIAESVRRLGKGGVKLATLTNGTFLSGEKAEMFAKHGTWVRVSMDYWDGASLKKSRKVKEEEFDKILENMRAFVKTGTKCVLGVSMIVSKDNHEHVLSFCKTMKEIGVDHVKLSGCVVSVDGKENNAYHAGFAEKVHDQIQQALTLSDEKFKVVDHYHELAERFDKDYTACPYLTFLTVIGADLKVYTCQDKAYTDGGTLGSIKDRSFKDFWFSEENKKKIFALDPSRDCKHHCVTHSKNLLIRDFLNVDQGHADFV